MIRWSSGDDIHRRARGSDLCFTAVGDSTQGRFSLTEQTLPAGGRLPPPHRHVTNDEVYVVLSGHVEFRVNDDVFGGSAGDFVLVQAGESHAVGNTSDGEARVLIIHAPALDEYFEDLDTLRRDAIPTREREQELTRHHGMEPT